MESGDISEDSGQAVTRPHRCPVHNVIALLEPVVSAEMYDPTQGQLYFIAHLASEVPAVGDRAFYADITAACFHLNIQHITNGQSNPEWSGQSRMDAAVRCMSTSDLTCTLSSATSLSCALLASRSDSEVPGFLALRMI